MSRGAGFGPGRGGNVGVVAEAEVSGMGPESAGVSDGAVAGGADFLDGRSFLSKETLPMWMGRVNMTSGDFRLTCDRNRNSFNTQLNVPAGLPYVFTGCRMEK